MTHCEKQRLVAINREWTATWSEIEDCLELLKVKEAGAAELRERIDQMVSNLSAKSAELKEIAVRTRPNPRAIYV